MFLRIIYPRHWDSNIIFSSVPRLSEMFPCKTRSRLSRFPRNCTKIHENCFAIEFLYICNITSRSQQHVLRPDIYKIFHREDHHSENPSTDAFRGSYIGKHSPPAHSGKLCQSADDLDWGRRVPVKKPAHRDNSIRFCAFARGARCEKVTFSY